MIIIAEKIHFIEAIDFIRTSRAKEDIITKTEINNDVSVEIDLRQGNGVNE
ncbi:MAG: hypothetical protein LBR59_02630 [Endomicrobium sp.]|nr:hypothetical protein [Endomicrobium sp.]